MNLYFFALSKQIKDWHLTIAIVIIVAIVIVLVSFGFIIPGIQPTAYLIIDGEHPPMENVSDLLRLILQNAVNMYGSCCFSRGYCLSCIFETFVFGQ